MSRPIKNELPEIHNFDEKEVSKRIAYFRKAYGLTQKELAEKIGINRYLISDYEQGRVRIYDEMIVRLANALEISTDKLLGVGSTEEEQKLPSLKLMKRLFEIEKLEPNQQKALLKNIDMFLKAAKHDQ